MIKKNSEPKGDKKRVALCIPSLTATFNHDLVVFLCEAMRSNAVPETPFQFRLHVSSGKHPIHLARNILADSAVEDDTDYVWWLDDDTVPPPDAFGLIPDFIASGADIMGGATPVMSAKAGGTKLNIKANGYEYNAKGDMMFQSIKPTGSDNEIVDVDACGMSATLMKIGVLTDPRMHLSREYDWMDGTRRELGMAKQKVYFKTWYDALGEIIRSEDLDFCQRAKKNGYTIKYNFGIAFGHNKVTNLNGVLQAAADMGQANWRYFAEIEKAAEAKNGNEQPRIILAAG